MHHVLQDPIRYYLLTAGSSPITFFPYGGIRAGWVMDLNGREDRSVRVPVPKKVGALGTRYCRYCHEPLHTDQSKMAFSKDDHCAKQRSLRYTTLEPTETRSTSKPKTARSPKATNPPRPLRRRTTDAELERIKREVVIENLSKKATNSDLYAAFDIFAPVESARVLVDRTTGKSRGRGIVRFTTPENAQLAVESLNSLKILGRPVSLSPRASRRPRPSAGARGPSGGSLGS